MQMFTRPFARTKSLDRKSIDSLHAPKPAVQHTYRVAHGIAWYCKMDARALAITCSLAEIEQLLLEGHRLLLTLHSCLMEPSLGFPLVGIQSSHVLRLKMALYSRRGCLFHHYLEIHHRPKASVASESEE